MDFAATIILREASDRRKKLACVLSGSTPTSSPVYSEDLVKNTGYGILTEMGAAETVDGHRRSQDGDTRIKISPAGDKVCSRFSKKYCQNTEDE